MALALPVAASDAAVDGEVVPLPVADCVAVLDSVAEWEPVLLLEGWLTPLRTRCPCKMKKRWRYPSL